MFPFILRIKHTDGMNQHCFPEVMLVYTIKSQALGLFKIDKITILQYFLEQKIKSRTDFRE